MAVGTVMVRYVTKHADPIMATGYHMLLGGVPLLLLSYQQEAATLAERLPQLTGKELYSLHDKYCKPFARNLSFSLSHQITLQMFRHTPETIQLQGASGKELPLFHDY